ncbi:bifunctional Ubiquitin-conjugating enzyme-RWD-like/Ubiquitin E2 variant [Babesia duncani]|uniref:Bifunctional Ubiquitin-conjugating enzyme-RWD-like/Ubiquitin E2 variant n=1 Tax=Babesia duncani TaxID=323732 RepID=A0AAD9UNH4_9APIC|nr:bifunctional Ubiquitin-conjugating enzyme-RWD-like/Ubiquitin E2 variant [Babesia duncani]
MAPVMFVVPSETIKIVNHHPVVSPQGLIMMPILQNWDPRNNLLEAVECLQRYFNQASPIYSIASPTSSRMTKQQIIDPRYPQDDIRLSTTERVSHVPKSSPKEELIQQVLSKVKNNRTDILRSYNYKADLLNLHMQIMSEYVDICYSVSDEIKRQNEIERKLRKWIDDESKTYSELKRNMNEIREFNKEASMISQMQSEFESKLQADDLINLVNVQAEQKGLLNSITSEASIEDMLQLCHVLYKRGKMATKDYIGEIRGLSHDKFLVQLQRTEYLQN